jgi:hypothetical protein
MSSIKVQQFAAQIGVDSARLIKQLEDAGIKNKLPTSVLSDEDKFQLLSYLRPGPVPQNNRPHQRGKITLRKPQGSIAHQSKSSGEPKEIPVRTIKNRTFLKNVDLLKAEEDFATYKANVANQEISKLRKNLADAENRLKGAENKIAELSTVQAKPPSPRTIKNPKVFISYSYDSDSHKEWVRDFAITLVENGVDTMLDQWLHPGDSLTDFMARGISESDFVLIICTENYKAKSDTRQGGVGHEGIISGELLQNQNHRKFIPLVKERDHTRALPIGLLSKLFINFSSNEAFESSMTELLLTLFQKRPKGPSLGHPPKF